MKWGDAKKELNRAVRSDLDPTALRVWIFVRFIAASNILVSRKTIAAALGLSEDHLTRIGKALKRRGLLATHRVHVGDRGGSRVVWSPKPFPQDVTKPTGRSHRNRGPKSGSGPDPLRPPSGDSRDHGRRGDLTSSEGKPEAAFPPAGTREEDLAGKVGTSGSRPRSFAGRSRPEVLRLLRAGGTPARNATNLITDTVFAMIQGHRKQNGFGIRKDPGRRQRKYLAKIAPWIIESEVDVPEFLDLALKTWRRIRRGDGPKYPTAAFLSGAFVCEEYEAYAADSKGGTPRHAGSRYRPPTEGLAAVLAAAGLHPERLDEDELRYIETYARNMRQDPARFPEPDSKFRAEIEAVLAAEGTC